jgi:hypothetical protein
MPASGASREGRLTTETPKRPARNEGWSRGRGLFAAGVAILVVVLTLVVSRLDLANELVVVRSQLTAANQELAENQAEIDELEDAARGRSEDVAACRDLAELSKRLQGAIALLQRGLEGGDQGRLAKAISLFSDAREEWLTASDRCAEAIPADEEG